ncbi:conserved hypothetical protein, partial [Ricinus communis]
ARHRQARVVQRQVGDQPPVRPARAAEAPAGRRFPQHADGRQRGQLVAAQVALRLAVRQARRHVAVTARQFRRQGGAGRVERAEVGVDEGDAHLVAGADGRRRVVAPRDPVVRAVRRFAACTPLAARRVQGIEERDGARPLAHEPHGVHAVDLVGRRMRAVGQQGVVGARVRQLHGRAGLREQIDDGGAAGQQ